MASRQQRFEGPDLETLLERVRSDLGDDARIVAANRVRRGGVGGFFSREHYEVIVERTESAATPMVVDLADPQTGDTPGDNPGDEPTATSVLELAEAVNGTERVRQGRRRRKQTAPDHPARNVEGEPVVDLTSRGNPGSTIETGEPLVSTETERFVEILDRIARDVEARSAGGDVNQPLPDPTGGRSLARGDDGEIYVVDTATNEPEEPAKRQTRARADRVRQSARAPRHNDVDITAEADRREEAEHLGAPLTSLAVTPFLPPRVRRSRDVEVIARPENVLQRLGLPARYIPRGVAPAQMRGALIESLAGLPLAAPLPEANGVVIAVIGIGAQPVVLARALATERGLDPDNLVLATERELGEGIPSWLQICDPATAEERRRSWRRRDHETLVAVSVPSVTAGDAWARAMLDRLEPTQTWGIVNAAWKVEDAEAWSDRLGGFDVIALEHLGDTVSPAAPLALDVPVGRLDGRPASALTWAEILCSRMTER